jgi:tetratricopeptide (TPR) repeat protein
MLHLLIGEITWIDGQLAGGRLARYVVRQTPRRVTAPPELISILERCLQRDPAARPAMADIAKEMEVACRSHGVAVPAAEISAREQPAAAFAVGLPEETPMSWASPAYWSALVSVHGGSAEQEPIYAVIGSKTMQALGELAGYDEIEPAMRELAEKDTSFAGHWTTFLGQKAALHDFLGDYGAALALLDRATGCAREFAKSGDLQAPGIVLSLVLQRAVILYKTGLPGVDAAFRAAKTAAADVSDPKQRAEFLRAYAYHLSANGDRDQALNCLMRAERELAGLVPNDAVAAIGLAQVYWVRGELERRWGHKELSAEYMRLAIARLKPLAVAPEAPENAGPRSYPSPGEFLAAVCVRRAEVLGTIGRSADAIAELRQGIEWFDHLVKAGESQHLPQLIGSYGTLGLVLVEAGRYDESKQVFSVVTGRLEDLVARGGRHDLDQALGEAYTNHATALERHGNFAEAEPLLLRGLELFEQRFQRAPGREIAHDYARALVNRGAHLTKTKRIEESLEYFDRAISIYHEYMKGTAVADLAADAAWARASRALSLMVVDRIEEAMDDLQHAVPVIRAEAERTQRVDLIQWVNYIRQVFGDREWGNSDV